LIFCVKKYFCFDFIKNDRQINIPTPLENSVFNNIVVLKNQVRQQFIKSKTQAHGAISNHFTIGRRMTFVENCTIMDKEKQKAEQQRYYTIF
jgi:hypothetical protein